MRLTHDGATFHTAHKTVNLLQANSVNYLAIQIIDLNQTDHICPIAETLSAVYEGDGTLQMLYSFSNLQGMGGRVNRSASSTCMQYVASLHSCWLAVIRINGGLTR